MAQNKPVKVKPDYLSSNSNKLYSAKPAEGADKSSELFFSTTNKDLVRINLNFKRHDNDKAYADLNPDDVNSLFEMLNELASTNGPDAPDTQGATIQILSNFAGGQWSPDPLPVGKLAVGRTKGVIWIGFFAKSKPVIKFAFRNTRLARYQNNDGESMPMDLVSKLATLGYSKKMTLLITLALRDRYIPWQHQQLIKEGKASPYSDPTVNYGYINTYSPGDTTAPSRNGGGSGGSVSDFDDDIPL